MNGIINLKEVIKPKNESALSNYTYDIQRKKLDELRLFTSTFEKVQRFENNVNQNIMVYIFQNDGVHLWDQFIRYGRRIDKLITCLTGMQYGQLINHIMYDEELYNHK